MKSIALFATAALIAAPLSAQPIGPAGEVAAQEKRTERVAQQLWDWAELGYLETRSSGLLQDELQQAGFMV